MFTFSYQKLQQCQLQQCLGRTWSFFRKRFINRIRGFNYLVNRFKSNLCKFKATDSSFLKLIVRFTTVPFKALIDQE